jgi:hypothetical protein
MSKLSPSPTASAEQENGKTPKLANVAAAATTTPSESLSKKPPKFDRDEYHRNYMRDYMRKRRQAEKREGK